MADWKTRGYVPDSDEEEDFIAVPPLKLRDEAERIEDPSPKAAPQISRSATSLTDGSLSTADKLEKALGDGFQIIRDVRGFTTADDARGDLDDDSPLSSPPSSPRDASSEIPLINNSIQLSQNVAPQAFDILSDAVTHVPRRSLRARAPIQEHPYMLEDAKYRQLMQDRGLKPVHLPNVQNHDTQEQTGEESQPTENFASSPALSSFDLDITSTTDNAHIMGRNSNSQDNLGDNSLLQDIGDDGLPDISQILRENGRSTKKTYRSQMRRPRLLHSSSRLQETSLDIFDIPDESYGLGQKLVSGSGEFRVPPSPPLSANFDGASNEGTDDDDVVNGRKRSKGVGTPVGLPTPLISSDNGTRKRTVTTISSPESSDGEDSLSDQPPEDDEDSQGLRWIRQKLRGVLPPSFVKLSMNDEPRTRPQQRSKYSPIKTSSDRGVARRTVASSTQTGGIGVRDRTSVGEAESSEPDDDRADALSASGRSVVPFPTHSINKHSLRVEDLQNDHEVDFMLPSTGPQRRFSGSKSQKHRQSRIDSRWAVINRGNGFDAASAGLTSRNVRKTDRQKHGKSTAKRKKTKHRGNLPGMSILDAPGFHDMTRQAQPQFLRVAARQALRMTHQREQSPSKKFFSLATKADTEELNDELKEWKTKRGSAGSTKAISGANVFTHRKCSSSVSARSASTTQSKFPISNPLNDLYNLKRSSSALLVRISKSHQNPATGEPAQLSGSIDPLTGDNLRDYLAQSKSKIVHRNRSGRGQLLTRALEPRAAQLESSETLSVPIADLSIRTIRKSIVKSKATAAQFDRLPSTFQLDNSLNNSTHLNQVRPRKPKKQIPRKTIAELANMNHEDILDDSTRLNVSQPNPEIQTVGVRQAKKLRSEVWVRDAFQTVQLLRLLPAGMKFSLPSLIGGQVIHKLQAMFHNPAHDVSTPVRAGPSIISAPASLQNFSCGQYNGYVRHNIATTLKEVHSLLFESEIERGTEQNFINCVDAIASIGNYFLDSACFVTTMEMSDTEYITELVTDFGRYAELFLTSASDTYIDDNPLMKPIILQCLNWLAVLTTYVHLLATKYSLHIQSATQTLCQHIIHHMLKAVFEPMSLFYSLHRLQEISGDGATHIIDQPRSFAQAEAVVIAWHILPMLARTFSPKAFYDELHLVLTAPSEHKPDPPTDQLSMAVVALCLVLPLTQFSASGQIVNSPTHIYDPDGASYSFILPYISNLIGQQRSDESLPVAGGILEVVEDVYLKMVESWSWKPPPSVAITLLRAYSWNSMLPFHTHPDAANIFQDLECVSLGDSWYDMDNDFFKFLSLIRACVRTFCSNATQESISRAPGKLRAFVFSMIPNNAPQFDAREVVQSAEFLALKNHFSLYVTLFTGVPNGFRPRLQQLEQQVDFSTSHYQVCQLAIATWRALAMFYIQQPDSDHEGLKGIGKWMNTMLRQSIACFEQHGQLSGLGLLQQLLSASARMITSCNSELQARLILEDDILATVELLLTKTKLHGNNEGVITTGLEMLHAYAKSTLSGSFEDTLIRRVQNVLKAVVQHALGDTATSNTVLVSQLMSAWFVTAQTMVGAFHKHWNDFVEPNSNLSIDFLSGLRKNVMTYQAKCHFYSNLVKADQSFFHLELRPFVFTTWVASLLLPVESMQFQHNLTNSILKNERDSLMMQDLAKQLLNQNADKTLTLQDVADSRITILCHIIQTIYGQQDCPEEEWLAGGLDLMTQKKLLDVMQKTMKITWLEMGDNPVAQNDYTKLIHVILNEMETYPMAGFKIDSWFYGSNFPRPRQTLDNIFKCRFGETGSPITNETIRTFLQQYVYAIQADAEELFHKELLRVFHCVDPLRSRKRNGTTQYSIDFAKQSKFLQIIFTAILECGNGYSQSLIVSPILRLMLELSERIQYRIDNLNPDNMRNHIITTVANLRAVREFLDKTELEHHTTAMMIRYVRVALNSVFALLEYGIELDATVHEMFGGNILRIYGELRLRLPEFLSLEETNAPVWLEDATSADETIIDRANTVYDVWSDAPVEDLNVVPESMNWFCFFEAKEPALTEEEVELRDFARGELEGYEGLLGGVGVDMGEVKEEILGLVRELKGKGVEVEEEEE